MASSLKKIASFAALSVVIAAQPASAGKLVLADRGAAPEFSGISTWLNSPPLTMKDLRGKVVLVDFWTYSCINCLRTLPHLIRWHNLYKDRGLVMVGVHTPEFSYEHGTEGVKRAMKRFGIPYPVAQDNGYATWKAYENQYWPATYLVDKNGRIMYQHFGEGGYEKTEEVIRHLLDQPGK